jgi:hypothetical protein
VQDRDGGDAGVPPLAQVGLVGVQRRGAACLQQRVRAGGAPEPAGGLPAEAERGGGLVLRLPGGAQLVHRGVPLPDSGLQAAGRPACLLLLLLQLLLLLFFVLLSVQPARAGAGT